MERLMALQQIIKHGWQKNSFVYYSINSKGICQAFVIFLIIILEKLQMPHGGV